MLLIIVLFSLLLMRIWGSGKRLQKDHWYFSLVRYFRAEEVVARYKCGAIMASIVVCLVVITIIHGFLANISIWLAAVFAALVLVFSMGRSELESLARRYIGAWHSKNWHSATESAQQLAVDTYEIDSNDWVELNHQMVAALSYRGFERFFVILFWFCLGGILPIVAYRLIALSRDDTESPEEAEQLEWVLWLLEWPALRVFGLSLAITGNFASCFAYLRKCLFDTSSSSQKTVLAFVESALSVEQKETEDPRCGERELREIMHLYSRTAVLWVCAIALIAILV